MKQIQLAKNEDSLALLNNWYDRFEARLEYPIQSTRVETSFGYTDVVETAIDDNRVERDAPPVVVLHGAMAGAPFALGEITDLPATRKIIAVNIPGQSTRAEQIRLDFRTDEYARWFTEVMESLSLEQAIVCGISWGGAVALQVAKHRSDLLRALILVVPASIVSGPVLKGIWHVGLPMMRYKLFPSERNLSRALAGLFTNTDDLWTPYLGDAIRHWIVDFTVPPLMKTQDLQTLEAPVFVIAADRDLSFPGVKLIERCKRLFPNLIGTHLLQNTRHVPSFLPQDRKRFTSLFEDALFQVAQAPGS